MNPASLREVGQLMGSLNKLKIPKNVSVVICPPFVYLPLIKTKIALGAQDIFPGAQGAFTGEVSTVMVSGMGVTYIILGHSERRLYIQEIDELIAKKVKGSVDAGLTTILCVGESAVTRKKGLSASKKFIQGQLSKNLALLKKDERSKVIIAYEPVWAISTMPGAKPDNPEQAAAMIAFIKAITGGKVLYGGSVNSKNAIGFLEHPVIDGALVGGASLKPEEFKKIIEAAA